MANMFTPVKGSELCKTLNSEYEPEPNVIGCCSVCGCEIPNNHYTRYYLFNGVMVCEDPECVKTHMFEHMSDEYLA